MRKIHEVLRLHHECGRSNRDIARAVGASPTTVADYVRRARLAGLAWPLDEALTQPALEAVLFPPRPGSGVRRPEPDWAAVHRELRRSGVTLVLLWQEYRESIPTGYGTAVLRALPGWEGRLSPTMRQSHAAGERLFVDYAGQTVTDHRRGHRARCAGAGLRRRAGGVELHLRRGELDPEPAGLDRRPCAPLAFLGGVPELSCRTTSRAA